MTIMKNIFIFIFLILNESNYCSLNQIYEARTIEQIGNPLIDLEQCGRKGMRSNVCDPDSLISVEQAYRLDDQIRLIYNDTTCVCQSSLCRIGGEGGYVVGVALIYQMKLEPDIQMLAFSNDDRYAEAILREGHWFAYQLLIKWKLGKCQEDLLIFYSMEDNMLYTMTNLKTSHVLTDELISSATQESLIFFYDREQIFDGIKYLLSRYKSILQSASKNLVHLTKMKEINMKNSENEVGNGFSLDDIRYNALNDLRSHFFIVNTSFVCYIFAFICYMFLYSIFNIFHYI